MVSIITPVFGKAHLTIEFVKQLSPYLTGNHELIIVDNDSPDHTLAALSTLKRSTDVDLTIYSHSKNVGFGKANNIGVNIAKYDKLLFISNDVQVLGDVVGLVDEYLNNSPRNAVGARLLNYNTGWNNFNETGVIPYIEGFCFAVRREVFDMVGGFDENIFIDMEDLDLSYRLHLAGIGLAQIGMPVMHTLGGSFSGLSSSRLDYTLQSQAYFLRKWHLTKKND